jgi:hypothetical protein
MIFFMESPFYGGGGGMTRYRTLLWRQTIMPAPVDGWGGGTSLLWPGAPPKEAPENGI